MAKELPYFKFTVADWLTGDIVFESFNVQGLFINICAIYWQRSGVVSVDDINKRFKNPPELAELTDRFISVIDGFISIKFLNEQFEERKHTSFQNSQNGSLGGRPKGVKTLKNKATAKRPLSEHKAKQSNIEKKRKEKSMLTPLPTDSEFKNLFAEKLKWDKPKLKYYYEALLNYSNQGKKYVDWISAARQWAARDEKDGKPFRIQNGVVHNNQPVN